jgi:hypothetical protein
MTKALRGFDERRFGGQQQGVAGSGARDSRRISGDEYRCSAHNCTFAESFGETASGA